MSSNRHFYQSCQWRLPLLGTSPIIFWLLPPPRPFFEQSAKKIFFLFATRWRSKQVKRKSWEMFWVTETSIGEKAKQKRKKYWIIYHVLCTKYLFFFFFFVQNILQNFIKVNFSIMWTQYTGNYLIPGHSIPVLKKTVEHCSICEKSFIRLRLNHRMVKIKSFLLWK